MAGSINFHYPTYRFVAVSRIAPMFGQFTTLPDYRLDILNKSTGKLVSTGYFTAKQEEQIGEIIRGLNTDLLTYRLSGITYEFDDKSSFGQWLAENTQLPLDPGL